MQLLLKKYKELKDLAEQIAEIVEEISDIQSAGSISQLLTVQNDANFELFDIKELYQLWQKCAISFVHIPQLAEFFAKVELVALREQTVNETQLTSLAGLKKAFGEVYACCRTGVKTDTFAELYASVQRR